MDFTDQICCWGIKLFYGDEIRTEIENGRHHIYTDATKLDQTVDTIFRDNKWEQDSWTAAKKAAIKDVLKDSLTERKQELLPNLLQAAKLIMMANGIKLPLTPEAVNDLSERLHRISSYGVFKPYEISYILRNFSAVTNQLAADHIITESGPNHRIRPREDLSDAENKRCGKRLQEYHQSAKTLHRQQKGVKIGSMLKLAQSLSRLGNATNPLNPHEKTPLAPESADRLCAKVRNYELYNEFEHYEVSYMLQNFSAITAALAQDQLINISPEGDITLKAHLNEDQAKRAGERYQTLHHSAKSVHEESKRIHEDETNRFSLKLHIFPEKVDNMIYKILYQVSPKFSGLLSHEQVVKAIEDKDPEILCKAYQTLEAHLQNPQKSTDPYQRRIF